MTSATPVAFDAWLDTRAWIGLGMLFHLGYVLGRVKRDYCAVCSSEVNSWAVFPYDAMPNSTDHSRKYHALSRIRNDRAFAIGLKTDCSC